MGRKRGKPAYGKKSQATSFITPLRAMTKLKAAERRTRKSRSDIITHCMLTPDTVDTVTRETMEQLAAQR